MNGNPIGVFDSGVGGTSIWKEIHKCLPNEDTIYLADSKNAPYGETSKEKILGFSIKNTEFLLDRKCKLIVVACNTATTNAIAHLRASYDVPFIGIEPAIKPAALQSKSKVIGVLATKGTLTSGLFHSTSENHTNGIRILEQEGTGLVPLIESGKINSKEVEELLKKFLKPMLDQGMDHLVLGCTHYPYLIPVLTELLPSHVKIIDSGEAVARQTKVILNQYDLQNTLLQTSEHQFYSNTDEVILKGFLKDVKGNLKVDFIDF